MATPSQFFYAMFPLQEVIFDKDDGTLLAAGRVEFYSDPAFTVPKDVYFQSNSPSGTYVYVNAGSILTLSSIGSFVDSDGNNAVPFLFPYTGTVDNPQDFEPYYIRVYSSGGVLQFTATGWPPVQLGGSSTSGDVGPALNNVLNPQFSEVIFSPVTSYVYNVTGTGTITQLAPEWYMETTGAGTVTVSQLSLNIQTPSQAPYALEIISSAMVQVNLFQRFNNSPRLFAGGNVAAYFEAASPNNMETVLVLNYIPSNGDSYQILSDSTTATGQYKAFSGSIAIDGTISSADASGYIDLSLTIPQGEQVNVTSFQLTSVPDLITIPTFEQMSIPLQQSQLFSYWQPALNYKPIPSYLVGWDFPLNPAQFGASGSVGSLGAVNKSTYIWDQTIAFQSVDNTLTYSRDASTNGLKIGCTSNTSFALIQYLDIAQAREILSQRCSIQVKGSVSTGTLLSTVSLYYTTDASLPDIKASNYNSLVSSIAAGGIPAVGGGAPHGNWTIVPRDKLGNTPGITLTTTDSVTSISGFDATATAAGTTATFFAIVIGFDTLASGHTVTIDYCSLVGGDIATRPAPQTPDEVLRECQYYYEKSYESATAPGTAATSIGELSYPLNSVCWLTNAGPIQNNWSSVNTPFTINLSSIKRVSTYTPVVYSPVTGTANNVDYERYNAGALTQTDLVFATYWSFVNSTKRITCTIPSATKLDPVTVNAPIPALSSYLLLHYVVDARLGVI